MRVRYHRAPACGGSLRGPLRQHPSRERRLHRRGRPPRDHRRAARCALTASFFVRPYALGAIDLKYRDLLLSLIARRDYYKSKLSTATSASGELLMRALLRELESSAHACALDAAGINAKTRLDELTTTVLSSPDPAGFASMRDELTELMLELPAEQRHTRAQIFHIYTSPPSPVSACRSSPSKPRTR